MNRTTLDSRKSKKLNVVLSENDYNVLQDLANERGITLSDLVREALRVGVWYQKEIAGQQRSLCVRELPDGPISELKFIGASLAQ